MYHLKVVRNHKLITIQLGCVDRMRELTMGIINYALDCGEFHSFEKVNFEVHRDAEYEKLAHDYVDEVAEFMYGKKQ